MPRPRLLRPDLEPVIQLVRVLLLAEPGTEVVPADEGSGALVARPDQVPVAVGHSNHPTPRQYVLIGVILAANLTPDRESGIGTWTKEMFIGAMRSGRHMGGHGRPVMPPMPWMSLGELSDDDLGAIFAYLKTVAPVVNQVPDPKVPAKVQDEIAKQYDTLLAAAKR